jgi:hypothetical protein
MGTARVAASLALNGRAPLSDFYSIHLSSCALALARSQELLMNSSLLIGAERTQLRRPIETDCMAGGWQERPSQPPDVYAEILSV